MTDLTSATEPPDAPPEPPDALAAQRRLWLRGAAVVGGAVVVAGIILIAVSGGNSPKPGASSTSSSGTSTAPTLPVISNAKVVSAGTTALGVLDTYTSATKSCAAKAQPTICLEAADRVAGNAIHAYANILGQLSEGAKPSKAVTTTLNGAQDLANSFEILGDAEPTTANYNKVLGHFNMSFAVAALKVDIGMVDASHGG